MNLGQNRCAAHYLAVVLALLLAMPVIAPLQASPQENSRLKVLILEGDGAINNIRQRTARDPIVQVQDENNKPVAGAVVTFLLPDRGPGGSFTNGSKSMSVTTDANGQASANGMSPNSVPGNFQIQVSASFQGQLASATIAQSNILGAAVAGGIAAGKLAAILAVVGGAVAGGVAYAVTQNNDSGPGGAGPPVSRIANVSAGNPTVGAPR